ncbi:uncharacterized protein N7496_008596 [Penicillium cataractarum]|uniref:Uncharacterized protein n=1 Tax=Penicillium cataractarum TaxID=2100454 RepID=A0A9W9RYQ9_9EURO|nr:uncharacterized protein N7496_008596 [Penicillium cataractarum]KAJ5368836.1 hypothetical protein N7496_008596 [Penicillium cataractarum]
MYGLSLLLTTALALGTATLTAATDTPPVQNKWAQLRLFGAPGCSADNMGEMGVYGYERNTCLDIAQYGAPDAVNISSIFDECELYLYEDAGCSVEKSIAVSTGCVDGAGPYGGLILSCSV